MAQITIKSRQINTTDVAFAISTDSPAVNFLADGIAGDPSAIETIALGVISTPAAIAVFDGEYLRRGSGSPPSTNSMLANLDLGGNDIFNVVLVDGRSISADGIVLDVHVADIVNHFTEASIVHQNINGAGTNDHVAIDIHIGDVANHFSVLNGLSDVDALSAATNQGLVFNGTSWTNQLIVNSFAGRTGIVVPTLGDYTATQIINTPAGNITSTNVQDAIDELDSIKSATTHVHGLDDLSDVDLSGSPAPVIYDLLTFDGVKWTAEPLVGVLTTDHNALNNIGVNTHAVLDLHLADASIHFTEASIIHQNISGVGTNTHDDIDNHIGNSALHFSVLDGLSNVNASGAAPNQGLVFDGTNWTNQNIVNSFKGRTGVVVPTTSDYSALNIDNTPTATVLATNVQAAINELDTEIIALDVRVTDNANDITQIQTQGPDGYTHVQSVANTIWSVFHNRNTTDYVYMVYDSDDHQIIPDQAEIFDYSEFRLTFKIPITGRVNVVFYKNTNP